MRIAQVLLVALALARIAPADNFFLFTINSATETATVNGGGLACGVLLPPTACGFDYSREEFITNPAIGCDPSNISLPLCPNDMTPLFNIVAVIDGSGNIEGVFRFEALSHSLVEDFFEYDLDLLPPNLVLTNPSAYIVDNGSGQPHFLDEMRWTDGEVDTFQFQFAPDPSSVALVSTVLVLCGMLRRRAAPPYPTRGA